MKGGFFEGALEVELTSIAGEVHYTTDGRAPTLLDPIYSNPISVSADAFVRACVFEEGHIPGPVVTHSYFLEPELS